MCVRAPFFSLFLSICLSACLTFCLPFFWRSDTVVNENLKSFRSPSRDRWKRRRGWFPNGVSPVYKSTPEVCLVGLCAPRAVLAALYFWVTREDIPPSGSFASLSLNANHAYDREMGNSGRLFGSRVVSRDATTIFTARGTPRQLCDAPRHLFQDRVADFKITSACGFSPFSGIVHFFLTRTVSRTSRKEIINCSLF